MLFCKHKKMRQNQFEFQEVVVLELTLLKFEQNIVGQQSMAGVEFLYNVLVTVEGSRLASPRERGLSFKY